MNYERQKKVACIGIGGGGVYFVAKYFLHLGVPVYGFDITKSEKTEELEKLGARITYQNPEGRLEDGTTLFVYSPGLPNQILDVLLNENQNIEHYDVGEFTTTLQHAFEAKILSESEVSAFHNSNIAPLYSIDSKKMTYIAVTGTDGKTSTSTMIYHLLKKAGFKPGLVSTVSAKIGEEEIDTGFHTTTPSAQELHTLILKLEAAKCTHAIIEVTSHGLAMGRIPGLKFHAIAYTNITSEHLDYHKTWENYYAAKELLLTEHTFPTSAVILNKDDRSYAPLLAQATRLSRKILSYSIHDATATLFAEKITETPYLAFMVENTYCELPILGLYNVSNALAAIATVAAVQDLPVTKIAPHLSDFETVTGRMQVIQDIPFKVIVDFAHTANALTNALTAMRKILPQGKKLIVAFGCAGKRDATKREPMGEAAGKFADISLLTAEDPRTERLRDINDAIASGWKRTATPEKQLIRFDDDSLLTEVRKQAIEKALELAQEGDIVLIAGKAHEQSLCFGTTEYPWNDIDMVNQLLS